MQKTTIAWADYSWNPIYAVNKKTGKRGWFCEVDNIDCLNCYAWNLNLNPRFGNGVDYLRRSRDLVEVRMSERQLDLGRRFNSSGRIKSKLALDRPLVFVCDMSDLFGEWVPDHYVDAVFDVMEGNPRAYFLLLTKRAERQREYFSRRYEGRIPPAHIWAGVSAGHQAAADEKVPALVATPAAKRAVSVEPMTASVSLAPWQHAVDLIIIGGESGKKARPIRREWALDLIKECRAAGVKVFFKQKGERLAREMGCRDRKGEDYSEFPAGFRVREMPR